jgi:hypothetical protein
MKYGYTVILAAVVSLGLAACKQPNEPSSPSDPDPKAEAQATDPNAPGTTTNFDTPAEPAKPAGE